jgi:hypothetical protein
LVFGFVCVFEGGREGGGWVSECLSDEKERERERETKGAVCSVAVANETQKKREPNKKQKKRRTHQQQGPVHHRRPVEHRRHQDVVPRAVHEGDVPNERHAGPAVLTRGGVFFAGAVRAVARGALASGALVDLCVGVAQLDGDVALELVLEAHGLHARDGFDDGGLAVGDVADGAYFVLLFLAGVVFFPG